MRSTRHAAEHYRVEPYVVAADIYSGGDKGGRGGWTWYTGSAGWLYRAAVEGILGIRREGKQLTCRAEAAQRTGTATRRRSSCWARVVHASASRQRAKQWPRQRRLIESRRQDQIEGTCYDRDLLMAREIDAHVTW